MAAGGMGAGGTGAIGMPSTGMGMGAGTGMGTGMAMGSPMGIQPGPTSLPCRNPNPKKGCPLVVQPGNVTSLRWTTTGPHPDVLLCCGGVLKLAWSQMDGGIAHSGEDRTTGHAGWCRLCVQ